MNAHPVSTQMEKLRKLQIDLVLELLRVCEKHHLKCWADSGTLLGAVRHTGFIPWDDDIDMIMFREDYDKLIHDTAHEFKKPYFLQSSWTDKKDICPHAHLRNINTTAILPCDIYRQFNQGVYIDIFILDGVSTDTAYIKQQERKLVLLRNLMECALYKKITKPKHLVSVPLVKSLWGWGNRHLTLYKKFENILRSVPVRDVEYVTKLGFYTIGSMKLKLQNKHSYDETVMLDFEHIKVPAPANYHAVLSALYGDDYMTPVKNTEEHVVIFDTERPSEEVLKELRNCQ
jgi:lipopolysaccharide cholinephosphotransferase